MKHIHFKEIDSTQAKAREIASEHDTFLITAQKQLLGRGRRDNKWDNLNNSISMSFKITPSGKPTLLALEIAVLICNYFADDSLSLKWPNDIYNSEGKKVAGILVTKENDHYIVGAGINIGPDRNSHINNYGYINDAVQLSIDDYRNIPAQLFEYINTNRLIDNEIISEWIRLCFHLGQKCEVVDGDEVKAGKFQGIGEYGEALIENNGVLEKAYTGSLHLK